VTDNRPPARIYAPYHPQADADGMVHKPNISPMEEMLDMITATRAYEANLSALRQSRKIAEETIRLGKA
jgi:flagellar basal-body rod protein FlgC